MAILWSQAWAAHTAASIPPPPVSMVSNHGSRHEMRSSDPPAGAHQLLFPLQEFSLKGNTWRRAPSSARGHWVYLQSCWVATWTPPTYFICTPSLPLCAMNSGPQPMDAFCEVTWVLRISGGTEDKWPPGFSMKEETLGEVNSSCGKSPGNSSSFCYFPKSFSIFGSRTDRENARNPGEWWFPVIGWFNTCLCPEVTPAPLRRLTYAQQ